MLIMKDSDLKAMLEPVEKTARRAGAEIMKHYPGTKVYTKKDGSNVTDADHASEVIILQELKALTPDIPIISEERVAAGEIPDISGGTFWVVDPLDGTTEFINKTGAFVVAISLVVDNKVALGVIYHPAMGLMYSGCGPGTASKTGADGIRTAIGTAPSPATDGLQVLVNEPHADMNRIKGYLSQQFGRNTHIDTKSGILRACRVAENTADMAAVCSAHRKGYTYWWDVAPGHAIIEAAGGEVRTFDGQPMMYDAEDLQVPPHMLFSPQRSKNTGSAQNLPHIRK